MLRVSWNWLRVAKVGIPEFISDASAYGKGFCTDGNYKGFGLQGMRERITAVQGQLKIVSQPNAGCIIKARFPRLSA
ncbi:MAG: hypothetical protein ACRC80_20930 [Waterburya sp.]